MARRKTSNVHTTKATTTAAQKVEATKAVVESSKADLIEHVAFEIIQAVKATSERISTVEVHLRKLAVPIEGIFDSAEIEMRG